MASGPPELLVVGGDGVIGAALAGHFAGLGWRVRATTRRRGQVDDSHPYLDLTAPEQELPGADFVILAAAIARIGDCESDPDAARRINVEGTLALARRLAGQGAHVLLLSSDKVFDGRLPLRGRHDEWCPACEYGRQKAEAEAGILALGDRGAVLRLSKVVAPGMELLAGWAQALAAGTAITPFHDLYLAPVPLDLVARILGYIGEERAAGIFHCTGAEDRSYVDLAHLLAAQMDADPGLIRPASCANIDMPAAARPRYTTLEMTLEQARWDLCAPPFEETAREVLTR